MSLKGTAKETLAILDRGEFRSPSGKIVVLGPAQERAVKGTALYRPEELEELRLEGESERPKELRFDVTDEKTQEAAHRLGFKEQVKDLLILNFASARNVGGGFLNGAKAQEEDVARCSGIYRCLESQPEYYRANRSQDSMLYTDHIIYSPDVPWFRRANRDLLEDYYVASIVTAPAPNAGEHIRRFPEDTAAVEEALQRRAAYVLRVAAVRGHRNLILGAWGCGVFRNDPRNVASCFRQLLTSDELRGRFDRVTFAVFDPTKNQRTLDAFRTELSAT